MFRPFLAPYLHRPTLGLVRTPDLLSRNAQRYISLKPDLSKFKLIPPPPGGVVGTVNEAVKPPAPDYFHGSYHWDYERITAVSLIPLTMIPLYGALSSGVTYPILDAALCLSLIHI